LTIEVFMIGVVIATVGALIASMRGNQPYLGAIVSGALFLVGLGPLGWLVMILVPRLRRFAR
jgi:hypothetical protein